MNLNDKLANNTTIIEKLEKNIALLKKEAAISNQYYQDGR